MTTYTTLAFGMPGWQELLILGVIGLLIFGKRLPEVGRSIGKGIVEFKKGLAGIDEEVEAAVNEQKKNIEADAGNTTNVETHAESTTKAEPSA
ncbi:MAG: twin-arginine translocase TatA/TatE family subunit [Phycisphaeraceae bacterium]|nr:twin-arginine translocase TatA/TatE family subunit [Phycisphaeraceae bacterium]